MKIETIENYAFVGGSGAGAPPQPKRFITSFVQESKENCNSLQIFINYDNFCFSEANLNKNESNIDGLLKI